MDGNSCQHAPTNSRYFDAYNGALAVIDAKECRSVLNQLRNDDDGFTICITGGIPRRHPICHRIFSGPPFSNPYIPFYESTLEPVGQATKAIDDHS